VNPVKVAAAVLAALLPSASPAAATTPNLAKPATSATAHWSRPHPHRQPWPVTLTIQTVPPIAQVRIAVDGTLVRTDSHGRASYTVEHDFRGHSLALVDSAINTATARYRFVRWAGQRDPDQAFATTITGLPMRANYTITAAFRVQYPVAAHLADAAGKPVDLTRISSITIMRDDGTTFDYPRTTTAIAPLWLDGQVPSYGRTVLGLDLVSYSVHSVVINGVNVVDAGRQRFEPATTREPAIVVAFHDLTVRAHDALFSTGLGAAAVITFPDGTVRTVPFGADHVAVLDGLPRGDYRLDITSGRGIVLTRTLRLSRPTSADLVVVSYLDLATVVGGLILVAVALLLIGRAGRLRRWLNAVIGRSGPASRGLGAERSVQV
jgi:hypothetical protein